MNIRISVPLLLAAFAALPMSAQQVKVGSAAGTVEITLSPAASPRGAAGAITLAFDGTLYQPALPLDAATQREAAKLSPAAGFLGRYFRAWSEGSYDDVAAYWSASEREEFGRYFPATSFASQRGLFQSTTEARLHWELEYGAHQLLLVEHRGAKGRMDVTLYAVRRDGERLSLSPPWLPDPVFTLFASGMAAKVVEHLADQL